MIAAKFEAATFKHRRIEKMPAIGYIVQYSNEDDYTVYHGFVKLHRTFTSALEQAKDIYGGYMENNQEQFQEPFEVSKPTKKQCDDAGSVVVFRSHGMIVWIDCVIE